MTPTAEQRAREILKHLISGNGEPSEEDIAPVACAIREAEAAARNELLEELEGLIEAWNDDADNCRSEDEEARALIWDECAEELKSLVIRSRNEGEKS